MDRVGLAAISVTLVVWASAFTAIRVGLTGYEPGHLALLRFVVASAVFALLAWPLHIPLPKPRDLPRILLAGFLGITVYHSALNYGEVQVDAGTASLLVAFVPAITALIALWLLKERLSLRSWIGVAIGFLGVLLIVLTTRGGFGLSTGALYILLAVVGTSFFLVLEKPLMERYTPTAVTAYITWAGTLFLCVWAPGFGRALIAAPPEATWSGVYMGIFPAAAAYALLNVAVARAPASVVSSFLYVEPVLATAFAWLWLGEVPGLWAFVGGAVVMLGVAFVSLRPRAPRTQTTSSAVPLGNQRG